MIKTNKVGVEMLQILSRNGNNAVILCRCPICGQQRDIFYEESQETFENIGWITYENYR